MEELIGVLKKKLFIIIEGQDINQSVLPASLKGQVGIILNYGLGFEDVRQQLDLALDLSVRGIHSIVLTSNQMSEKEVLDEISYLIQQITNESGYISTVDRGFRWFGPRFQFNLNE